MAQPDVIHDLAAGFLAYLADGMTDAGIEPPDRQLVSHGTPVEEVTDGGCVEQLAVYWTAVTTSQAPLQPDGPGTPVFNPEPGTALVMFVAELVRCAPVMDDHGNVPSAEDLTDAAAVSSRDAWALFNLSRRSPKRAPSMFGDLTGSCEVRRAGAVVPFGPRGGVQGVAVEVMTQVDLSLWSPT